ncbi:UNVERIFIED_CONTAM: hypothetical protein FKN15_074823 [Acipenser sinensis]
MAEHRFCDLTENELQKKDARPGWLRYKLDYAAVSKLHAEMDARKTFITTVCGLPIESITGAEALVESCGDGEPQKKKRATEQSISSSRGETLGSPVYEI